jgi:hypothetical protein
MGNGPHTKAALSHGGNGNSVLGLKLLVSGRFLHVHTLQEMVLHFIFEAAFPRRLRVLLSDVLPVLKHAPVRAYTERAYRFRITDPIKCFARYCTCDLCLWLNKKRTISPVASGPLASV